MEAIRHRLATGLSPTQVARELGVSRGTVYKAKVGMTDGADEAGQIRVRTRERCHPSRGVTPSARLFELRSARCSYMHVRAVWPGLLTRRFEALHLRVIGLI